MTNIYWDSITVPISLVKFLKLHGINERDIFYHGKEIVEYGPIKFRKNSFNNKIIKKEGKF